MDAWSSQEVAQCWIWPQFNQLVALFLLRVKWSICTCQQKWITFDPTVPSIHIQVLYEEGSVKDCRKMAHCDHCKEGNLGLHKAWRIISYRSRAALEETVWLYTYVCQLNQNCVSYNDSKVQHWPRKMIPGLLEGVECLTFLGPMKWVSWGEDSAPVDNIPILVRAQ